MLVLLLALYATDAFASLQGRFSAYPGSPSSPIVRYSLATSSPSGGHSVSASDTVFIFDASGGQSIPSGRTFEFEFETEDADIDPNAEGESVFLYHEGNLVGEGTIDVDCYTWYSDWDSEDESGAASSGTSCSDAFVEISLNQRIGLFSGKERFELQLNSGNLLDDDPAEDDPLDITMTVGTQTVVGNTLNY